MCHKSEKIIYTRQNNDKIITACVQSSHMIILKFTNTCSFSYTPEGNLYNNFISVYLSI